MGTLATRPLSSGLANGSGERIVQTANYTRQSLLKALPRTTCAIAHIRLGKKERKSQEEYSRSRARHGLRSADPPGVSDGDLGP